MSKYADLTDYLTELDRDRDWTLSFAEIEKIIGDSLPDSARRHQAWWANQTGKGHTQSFAWGAAGWRTSNVDLENERVTFVEARLPPEPPQPPVPPTPPHAPSAPVPPTAPVPPLADGEALTIEQAKRGLARTFGVDPAQIEITIRG
jgi:hypothetical protein